MLTQRHPVSMKAGAELAEIVKNKYGFIDYEYGIATASTDFVSDQLQSAFLGWLKRSHRVASPTVRNRNCSGRNIIITSSRAAVTPPGIL